MLISKAICLNCIEGEAQLPVMQWIHDKYGVEIIDLYTEPGLLSKISHNTDELRDLIDKIKKSNNLNELTNIFVVDHDGCSYNSGHISDRKQQLHDIIQQIKCGFNDVNLTGLWLEGEKVTPINSA